MSLFEVFERFPSQQACFEFLEGIRFKEVAYCPHCASAHVGKKGDKNHIGRWNCYDCYSTFRVTHGTLFYKTKIELQKWFLAVILMLNAKKSLSSHQLARDLSLNQKTAWYIMTRVRKEMESKNGYTFLQGIVEADETFIGGKSQQSEIALENKTPVLGAVERGGSVVTKPVEKVTRSTVTEFLHSRVKFDKTTLMTDENVVYQWTNEYMPHKAVKHSHGQYVDGDAHTNTLEGFWGLLKRAWYGSHHKYTVEFLPLYVAEMCYRYNNRKRERLFDYFVRGCFD